MALSVGKVGKEFLPGTLYTSIKGDLLADLSEFNGMDVYGIRYHPDHAKAMPVCKSRDMIWKPASPNGPGIDDYKNVAPFNVRKCFTTYKDFMPFKRMILAYEGEDNPRFGDLNYAQIKAANGNLGDGNFANRMVEFPRGYFYCPDKYTVLVSPTKIDERWNISPAHDLGPENTVVADGQVSSVCCSEFRLSSKSDMGTGSWSNGLRSSITCSEWRSSLPEGMYPISLGFYNWFVILAAIKHNSFNFLKSIGEPDTSYVINEDNIQGLDGRSNSDLNVPGTTRVLGIQNAFASSADVFLSNAIMLKSSASGINHPTLYCKQDVTNVETVLESSAILSDPKWKQIGVIPFNQAYLYKPNFQNSKQSFFIPTEEDESAYKDGTYTYNPNAAFACGGAFINNDDDTPINIKVLQVSEGGSYMWYFGESNTATTTTNCLSMEFMK